MLRSQGKGGECGEGGGGMARLVAAVARAAYVHMLRRWHDMETQCEQVVPG